MKTVGLPPQQPRNLFLMEPKPAYCVCNVVLHATLGCIHTKLVANAVDLQNWSGGIASGDGTIYAHAMLHREYHPRHRGRLPLVIAWVDLVEGVRMPTNIVGSAPENLSAGLPVRVDFEQEPGGYALPVFRLRD